MTKVCARLLQNGLILARHEKPVQTVSETCQTQPLWLLPQPTPPSKSQGQISTEPGGHKERAWLPLQLLPSETIWVCLQLGGPKNRGFPFGRHAQTNDRPELSPVKTSALDSGPRGRRPEGDSFGFAEPSIPTHEILLHSSCFRVPEKTTQKHMAFSHAGPLPKLKGRRSACSVPSKHLLTHSC